jgi:flagellar biosynthetic protein FlhB/flagellar biosynthetic protein FliR/FlhB
MVRGIVMSEKTEKATPYKLQKAKENGQVSKSLELNTYTTLLIVLGLLVLLGPQYTSKLQNILKHVFSLAGRVQFSSDHLSHLISILAMQLIALWLPIAFITVLTIILSNIVQTGLTWAPAALTPNFKRLHLAQGLKKLFSITNFFEALKTFFKLLCSFTALAFIFKNQLHFLVQNTITNRVSKASLMESFICYTALKLVVLLLLFSLIDKKFTRWKFNKDQRMSKQEVKEEYKKKEGDPIIKQKIRQLQSQLRKKTAALTQVRTADVIITNPTHIAIALKYKRGEMPAPKVVYKAQDKMVLQVKELAKKHSIPIIEHKILARMLHYSTELNQYINKELFPLTAQIFRDLYRQEVVQ